MTLRNIITIESFYHFLAFPGLRFAGPALGAPGGGGGFRGTARGCRRGSGRLEGVWCVACAAVGGSAGCVTGCYVYSRANFDLLLAAPSSAMIGHEKRGRASFLGPPHDSNRHSAP